MEEGDIFLYDQVMKKLIITIIFLSCNETSNGKIFIIYFIAKQTEKLKEK